MTNDNYLANLLASQNLTTAELDTLRSLREDVEHCLMLLAGRPRFYYGGSYGKKTMIRERYDLDIVAYWPQETSYTLQGIFEATGQQLQKKWQILNRKTVAWEIPFSNNYKGFHIDVVPGRSLDSAYQYANLYRTDTGTSLKTSIKTHIDTVRGSNRRDVIRLLKLWKERKKVQFKKSFLLEMMAIDGTKNIVGLEQQLISAFIFIRDNIMTYQAKDPANSNNSLSDDLSSVSRFLIQNAAQNAIDMKTWDSVFSMY